MTDNITITLGCELTEENKDSQDVVLLDSEPAHIRETGGVVVQRIPRKWKRRRDLRAFFQSQLEVRLVLDNGQHVIEIRRLPKDAQGT